MGKTITSTEIENRILAVLYCQPDGTVYDPTGKAIMRVARLMVQPPTGRYVSSTLASAVRRLERRGLAIRDLRPIEGREPRQANPSSAATITPSYCMAVGLAVEKDELFGLAPGLSFYIDELRVQIKARSENKMVREVKTAKAKEKAVVRSPRKKPEQMELTPINPEADSVAGAIADALLAKVIAKIAEKPKANDIDRIHVNTIDILRERLIVADHNLNILKERVDELATENETLKKAARSYRSSGGQLTAQISELLNPEDREALARLQTERPNATHVDKPEVQR